MEQMRYEVREQPDVLRALLEKEYPTIRAIAQELRQRDIRHVLMVARGSSGNAATYAKYLFGTANRLPVAMAAPSLYTVYQTPPSLQNTLVVAISQSGASPDIIAVVEDARAQGAPTIAMTNAPDSPLAQAAERVIYLQAGQERAVAATKTYTAELMAVALLSVALNDDARALEQLRRVPEAVARTLEVEESIQRGAERYRYMTGCAVIGRGYNYASALEVALKLKELTYTGATPYSSADFLHGPIAVVEPGFPVLLIAPGGRVLPDLMSLMAELQQREAELLVISDDQQPLEHAQRPIRLPVTVDEWLSPIVAVVPGQLLAYHLAIAKGLDPDKPRGLRKVTQTR
jgi:glucosamine--fructose-6-phosphate aminotransferase (isomerizing)